MKKNLRVLLSFLDQVVGRIMAVAWVLFMFYCECKYSSTIFNGMDLLLLVSLVGAVIFLTCPISYIYSWIKTRIKNFIRFINEDNYDHSYDDYDEEDYQ